MGRKGWHIVQVPASARGEKKVEKQREGGKSERENIKIKIKLGYFDFRFHRKLLYFFKILE